MAIKKVMTIRNVMLIQKVMTIPNVRATKKSDTKTIYYAKTRFTPSLNTTSPQS